MIIQTSLDQTHLVILQTDHARMSGQFAAAFGNAQFAPPQPAEPIIFAAAHHDEGWTPIDARVEQDPQTGLPYHLTQTPLPYLLQTSAGSPAFNEQRHPYSGILSSMHTVGLFNGRYGLSDKVFINLVPAEQKPAVQAMLNAELARQTRLQETLRAEAETAVFATNAMLFHNYKLLQFYDTLALYFQMVHEAARGETNFPNVPRSPGDDVTITIRRAEPGVYALTPYPFRTEGMTFNYRAYPMTPQPIGTDLQALLSAMEPVTETVTLMAAK